MNLVNFHKHPKNKKYVQENMISFCGQGLVNSYWIMPIGNGYNKYFFQIEYQNKISTILVEERHVLEWQIGVQYDEEHADTEPRSSVSFSALGEMMETGQYFHLRSTDCCDFVTLNGELKIIDITVKNDHEIEPFISVNNEYQYCDLILCPRQELIDETLKIGLDLTGKRKLTCNDLVNRDLWNQKLYFVFDNYFEPRMIPFRIIEMKENNEITLNAYIIYYQIEIHVPDIILFYNPELEDEYNIQVEMQFKYAIINEKHHEEILDYCYLMVDEKID